MVLILGSCRMINGSMVFFALGSLGIFKDGASVYVGMLIVRKELRGKGIGRVLLNTANALLTNVPAILDADPGKEGIYKKYLGFTESDDIYQYTVGFGVPHDPLNVPYIPPGTIIADVSPDNLAKVMAYDMSLQPGGYRKYVASLLLDTDAVGLYLEANGNVMGIVTLDTTIMTMGLYAESKDIAEILLSALVSKRQGEGNYERIKFEGISQNQENMMDLLGKFNLIHSEPKVWGIRMSNSRIEVKYSSVYAVINTRCLIV